MEETNFEQCALASRLVTQEQLRVARERLKDDRSISCPEEIPGKLSDYLVSSRVINAWQAQQLLAGRTKFNLGTYDIIDSIGKGGMGQVFKARHSVLGRIVAVKVLPLDKSTPQAVEDFQREIHSLASLDHPNLVKAFDAGEDGNVYYLVTEYVAGSDLRKLVRKNGPLSMEAAASIIVQVAAGLQHAHDAGLIHRDVKPGNILVTLDGVAKLSDMGLAGPMSSDAYSDPRSVRVVGTADYISPDQVRRPWEPRPAWDIYSLGCTLYYTVTGKVPFPGGTPQEKVRHHEKTQPLDPRRLNPLLSADFVDVMADMMAKDPEQRIQTGNGVIQRLRPWSSGTPHEIRLQDSESSTSLSGGGVDFSRFNGNSKPEPANTRVLPPGLFSEPVRRDASLPPPVPDDKNNASAAKTGFHDEQRAYGTHSELSFPASDRDFSGTSFHNHKKLTPEEARTQALRLMLFFLGIPGLILLLVWFVQWLTG